MRRFGIIARIMSHHMSAVPSHDIARICDIPISQINTDQVLREIERVIAARRIGSYISITNTESMYHAMRIPAHLRYIQGADYSLCDGVGVIAAGWAWG